MTYRLKISQGNNIQVVELPSGKIQTTPNTTYQIISESGEVLSQEQFSNLKLEGSDLYIYLGNSTEPSFILENYTNSFPIDNLPYLEQQAVTFATAIDAATAQSLSASVLATEVTAISTTTTVVGLGILAAGGLAMWLSMRNDGDTSPSQAQPTLPTTEENPAQSLEPEKSVEPTQPTEPEKAVEPTQPTEPTEPEKAVEPTQPTEPEKAVEPTQPTEPEKAVEPTQPTEPEKAVEPTQPTEPEKTVEPVLPPELILTVELNDIAMDNFINKTESQGKIVVSGALSANLSLEQATVEVVLNNKTYLANLSANHTAFQVEIDGGDFADNTEFKVNASGQNGESKGSATAVGYYQFDATAPTVEVSLDPIVTQDDVVNQAASQQRQTLSGELTYSNDVEPASVKVTVEINGKTYPAVVEGKRWTLEIAGNELAFSEGKQTMVVKAEVADKAGNKGEGEIAQIYVVDTVPPEATIKLNAVDLDNKVPQDATGDLPISGWVEGEFTPNSIVNLTLGEQTFQATVAENGEFSVNVPASVLIANTDLAVKASLQNADKHGNVKEVTAQQDYKVVVGDIHISLDNITGTDELINVTEGQATTTLVSGKIWGEDASQASEVTVQVNGKSLKAAVNADLTFSVAVDTADLKETTGYKLTAIATGSNNAKATAERAYDISPDVVAKIDITQIDDFAIQRTETTRLSGKINLSGVPATGQNPYGVKEIQLTIGGKTYELGVNAKDQTFFVDIPTAELANASGSEITYAIKATGMYELVQNKNGSYTIRNYTFKPENATLTFDKLVDSDTSTNTHKLATIAEPTSVISGEVSGVAVVGDKIKVAFGGNSVETEVKEINGKLGFSVEVETKLLAENASKAVTATLTTTDKAGKVISVSDVEIYSVENVSDATFVSPHTQVKNVNIDHTSAGYNFPYFIDKVSWDGPKGFHANTPYGGNTEPLVVKYAFVSAEQAKTIPAQGEGNIKTSATGERIYKDTPEYIQEIIRGAYKKIEEYANIKFEEVSDPLDATVGTQHYQVELGGRYEWSEAIAFSGGDFLWSKPSGDLDYKFYTALHEITHTLGMNHNERDDGVNYVAHKGYSALEATTEFTNMSYNYMGTTQVQRDLRMYDLAFLHYRFGVNPTQRTEDNVYGFRNFNFDSSDGGGMYIWDGGGVDLFDGSKETKELHINLTPGSWVYKGSELKANFAVESYETFDKFTYFGLTSSENVTVANNRNNKLNAGVKYYHYDQAFIGYGTQIENAVGGSGNDEIIGNNANNNIDGGMGDDTLKGGAGDDYLNGGTGADKLFGELGNDTYVVDNVGDVVTETADQGTDTVYSSVDYTLTENVENLILTGTTAITATGNDLANTITANNIGNTLVGGAGNDLLIGGLGKDTLTGGEGEDTFVFSSALNGNADEITDFTSEQDKIELAQAVFSVVSEGMADFADYIQYDATSGKLSYDQDGKGSADAIHFATLTTGLTIDQTQFIIA